MLNEIGKASDQRRVAGVVRNVFLENTLAMSFTFCFSAITSASFS